MDRQQNISYAQAVCRRTAKEEIEAFKTNIINIQQLTKIVTTAFWETNRDDFNTFEQVWYDGLLFKLTSMDLNRKLIRWISIFLYQRKLIITINDQLSDPITPIHGVP